MLLKYNDLTIRNATTEDAGQLAQWWNDGTIMAHAGFPNGIGESADTIAESLKNDSDAANRRLILEIAQKPIGEMNYSNMGGKTAEIGIKICDFSLYDKGLGKLFLSMLIASLFKDMGYEKIILDTNKNNKRAQHTYESLGFRKIRTRENAWRNQLGELQSSVDYELYPKDFIDYTKNSIVLQTPRLYLRRMTQSDFGALCQILQDKDVMYAYEHAFSGAEVQEWLDRQMGRYERYGFGLWAVILKDSGEFIGQCGLTMQEWEGREVLEVGYLFRKAYWKKGYAAEAAIACKNYAFENHLADEVYSIIRDNNVASQNVAKRNGMTVCGKFIKHYYGMEMPHLVFSVKREDRQF